MMQEKYWITMTQKRFEVQYIAMYLDRSISWQRWMNIISAIASSSSIAAWIIWSKLDFVWAAIIAVSHLIVAVRPFLPFDKRVDQIDKLHTLWQGVYLELEKDWYPIMSGEINDKEINEKLFEFEKRWNELETEYTKGDKIRLNDKMTEQAGKENMIYFERLAKCGGE